MNTIAPKRVGFRWNGLIPQLFIFIILPLILLVGGLVLVSITLHDRSVREMASMEDLRVVQAVASTFQEAINHRMDALQSLGDHFTPGSRPADVLNNTDYLVQYFDGGAAFYDRQGSLLVGSDAYQLEPTYHPQVQALISSLSDLTQTPPIFSPDSIPSSGPDSSPIILMATRVSSNLEVIGLSRSTA